MVNFSLAAKSFIVNDQNQLLILKREPKNIQKPNIWEIPGGRLEPGENPIEGMKREVREEAGIEIEVLHPFSVRHFTRDDGQVITMLVFLCKALSKEVKLSSEHTAYDWISLDNCKDKLTNYFHQEVDLFHQLELKKQL